MKTLFNLGDIKVIEESACKFYEIGAILLNDNSGSKTKSIELKEKGDSKAVMREIYMKWLQEDEQCSWKTLCYCFRECSLNDLARRIEKYFRLPSPGKFDLQ